MAKQKLAGDYGTEAVRTRWVTLDEQQETSRSVYAPRRMGFRTGM